MPTGVAVKSYRQPVLLWIMTYCKGKLGMPGGAVQSYQELRGFENRKQVWV